MLKAVSIGSAGSNESALGRSNTIALFGDSQSANCTLDNSFAAGQILPPWRSYATNGYWNHINCRLGHRLKLVANHGVAGDTTTQMAARINNVLAISPKIGYVMIFGGINDVKASVAASVIQANLLSFITTFQAANIIPIVGTIPPCGQVTSNPTLKVLNDVNAYLKNLERTLGGFFLLDFTYPISDTGSVSPSGGNPSGGTGTPTSTTVDYLHFSSYGAGVIGDEGYNKLNDYIPRFHLTASSWGDQDNILAVNVNNNIPLTSGTSGTLSGTATGVLATGLVVTAGTATGGVALSKVARAGTAASEWQQIQLTAGTCAIRSGTVGTGFSVGDVISGSCDFETDDDWSGITAFQLTILFGSGSVNDVNDLQRPTSSQLSCRHADGVLKTPAFPIPSGTTSLQWQLTFNGGTGTVRFSNVGIFLDTV